MAIAGVDGKAGGRDGAQAMGADQFYDFGAEAASALDWWADAGVDVLVEDAARDWLAAAPAARAVATPDAAPAVPPAGDALPDTLEAFLAWRVGADAPEAGWRGASIAASGPATAEVMVLVDCPEADDGRAGTLLTGASGRLFDRMLAAIGLSRETVHLAAVCARRPVAGQARPEFHARLGAIAQHHVALLAPKRLLVMGNAASRAVLGADVAPSRGRRHPVEAMGGATEVVATFPPRLLLEKPACKAEAWADLRLLIGDLA